MFKRSQIIDPTNGFRTQSLFLETRTVCTTPPLMTLKEIDWEHNGVLLPSLRRMYMEEADLTEYKIAMRIFGSWQHWQKLCKNRPIMNYVTRYREELEVRIRSGAVQALINTALDDGSKGTAAAKYIADRGYDKIKAPTKKEKEKETSVQAQMRKELEEDAERVGLH